MKLDRKDVEVKVGTVENPTFFGFPNNPPAGVLKKPLGIIDETGYELSFDRKCGQVWEKSKVVDDTEGKSENPYSAFRESSNNKYKFD